MRLLYNILFTVFFVLGSPYYFRRLRRRGNWQAGFGQRFGRYDSKLKQAITNRHVLWVHAVGVGEINLCTQLIWAIEPRMPNMKIVVSTTTTTGMAQLEAKLPNHISKIYYPIDRRSYVSRSFNAMNPQAIVLIESEIWPNFLWRARDVGRPVFLVNARLSERSFRRYKRFGFLFRPIFASFRGIVVQNEQEAARLRELGCRPEAIRVVGSLQFDAATLSEPRRINVPAIFNQIGVPNNARVLLGGSTYDGEEIILAEQFLRLRQRFPEWFLVLVPHHFERCRAVGKQLAAKGLKFIYRNDISIHTQHRPGEFECLLVNTPGELNNFYKHADLIFVGKSLTAEGGQNPVEPAALGKAMVFGPNMQNFSELARGFVAHDGAVQVADAAELEKVLGDLLANEGRRAELGLNAQNVLHENLGAIERTVEMIVEQLEGGELYVAPRK